MQTYQENTGGGVAITIGGSAGSKTIADLSNPLDITISGGLNLGKDGNTITIQGHSFQEVPWLFTELGITDSIDPSLNIQKNYISIYSAVAGCTVTLDQDTTYNQTSLKKHHFIQDTLGGAITFVAGAGVTILTLGTTPKTVGAGSTVTATWLSATKVLLTGALD